MVDGTPTGQADAEREPSGPDPRPAALDEVESHPHERRAEESKDDPADRAAQSTAWATWVIACFTFVAIALAAAQYFVLGGQLEEMRRTRTGGDASTERQLDVMREQARALQAQAAAAERQAIATRDILLAADRPWLQSVGLEVEGVTIIDGQVLVRADLRTKNVGRSPALDVRIFPVLEPSLTADEEASETRRICGVAKATTGGVHASLVFPGEERTFQPKEITFVTDVDAIRRHKEAMIRADLAQRRDLPGKEEAAAAAKRQMDLPLRDELTLLGCATYRAAAGGDIHSTSFGLNLSRACDESPVGRCTFDFSGPSDYPRGRLIGGGLFGAGYAD